VAASDAACQPVRGRICCAIVLKLPKPPVVLRFGKTGESYPPETVANILICLIHQANWLLDQQLRRLEQDFLNEGGLRERMTRARLASRAKQGRYVSQ
jgi:four helix bundle suffix protein